MQSQVLIGMISDIDVEVVEVDCTIWFSKLLFFLATAQRGELSEV